MNSKLPGKFLLFIVSSFVSLDLSAQCSVGAGSSVTNVTCFGETNGAIDITPSGGTAPFTFSWNDGTTTEDRTNLAAGTYTVTVTDANACTATSSITITEPTALTAGISSQTDVSCNGGTNGAATVVANGGTGFPVTGSNVLSSTLSASGSGSTFSFPQVDNVVSIIIYEAAYAGVSNTQFQFTDGTDNYTFLSYPNSTGQTITVNTPSPMSFNQVTMWAWWNSAYSTSIQFVTASGYTYSWSPAGGTAATASGLTAGTYTVTVTDANGCTAASSATITEPTALSASMSAQANVSCNGGSDGSATVTANGGTGSYTYSWSPVGGTAATASNLAAGTYTVTVTDANACTATSSITITEPTALTAGISSQTDVSCNGGTNGAATVVANGGTGFPVTGSNVLSSTLSASGSGSTFSFPQVDNVVSIIIYEAAYAGVSNTQFQFTDGTDNYTFLSYPNSTGQTITVNTPNPMSFNQVTMWAWWNSAYSTSIQFVTASGYTYSWSPAGGTAATASGLTAGTYTVTVTDANGCTAASTATITEPAAITGTATITECYSYTWPANNTTYTTSGTYTATIPAANSCDSTITLHLTIEDVLAPTAPVLSDLNGSCDLVIPTPTAIDNCAGTITGTTTDATAFANPGTYTINWTFDDGNGNTATETQNVIITDVASPIADVTTLSDVTAECSVASIAAPTATDNCAGTLTGVADVTFPITAQGTTVVTWTFDDGNGNTATQTQNVIITDVTGPVADVTTLSDVTAECSVASIAAPTATDNCAGTLTGIADVTFPITAQGTTVVTWTFDDGNGNTATQTQNVIITDITDPVADVTTLSDVTAECSVASIAAPTATDNCAGTLTGVADVTFPITAQGTTVVTWTFDDGNGNTATQTQNVIITDITDPVADVTTLSDVTAECSVASIAAPTATDNCAGTLTGVSDVTFPITAQGTTVVTWTFDDGNGNTVTQTQNVIIIVPVATTTTSGLTITATTSGADYQWINCGTGNTPITGATSQSFTATANGSYAVIVTENGCSDTSDCVQITTVGLENINVEALVVYPNPSVSGKFQILYDGEINSIEARDLSGRAIKLTFDKAGNMIDASELAPGKYILKIETAHSVLMKEIVLTH